MKMTIAQIRYPSVHIGIVPSFRYLLKLPVPRLLIRAAQVHYFFQWVVDYYKLCHQLSKVPHDERAYTSSINRGARSSPKCIFILRLLSPTQQTWEDPHGNTKRQFVEGIYPPCINMFIYWSDSDITRYYVILYFEKPDPHTTLPTHFFRLLVFYDAFSTSVKCNIDSWMVAIYAWRPTEFVDCSVGTLYGLLLTKFKCVGYMNTSCFLPPSSSACFIDCIMFIFHIFCGDEYVRLENLATNKSRDDDGTNQKRDGFFIFITFYVGKVSERDQKAENSTRQEKQKAPVHRHFYWPKRTYIYVHISLACRFVIWLMNSFECLGKARALLLGHVEKLGLPPLSYN